MIDTGPKFPTSVHDLKVKVPDRNFMFKFALKLLGQHYFQTIGWILFIYEGKSIKNQPNLFLGEIDLFFFNVIALRNDALGPMVFQCHQPRTEEARVLVSDPLLNCPQDFFVGPEMTSRDILFQVRE